MTILLNDVSTPLPKEIISLADLVNWKNIPSQGTAIALNNKLIKQAQWAVTTLNDLDQITIISAAYGG